MLFVYLENNKLRNGEDGMVQRDLQVSAFVHNTAGSVLFFCHRLEVAFKRQIYCQNVLWNKTIWYATLQLETNKVSSSVVQEMYDIFAAFNKRRKL